MGLFLKFATDDNDLKEKTIDAKNTTQATTMVVYKPKRAFGPEPQPTIAGNHSERRRSLRRGGSVYELQGCSAYGRRPKLTKYIGTVDKEWLKGEGGVHSEATNTDDTWTFLRMKAASLLKTDIEAQEEQPIPSWAGFNSILYSCLARSFSVLYWKTSSLSLVYMQRVLQQRNSSAQDGDGSSFSFDVERFH